MKRVAILGGGMAGLAAAWALTGGDCRGEIEVTVFQRGWRLGGKGASSRGVHGRIEEHGLHVWLGYYDNAFSLMRQVYEELDRPTNDPSCSIPTFNSAFFPSDRIGVTERRGDSWTNWLATFSRNDGEPGLGKANGSTGLSVAEFVRRGITLLFDFAVSVESDKAAPPAGITLSGSPRPPRSGISGLDIDLERLRRRVELLTMVAALEALRFVDGVSTASDSASEMLLRQLDHVRIEVERQVQNSADSRRTSELTNLLVTCLRGAVADRLIGDPRGFVAIDRLDFREWLRSHGATDATVDSALIRGMYDLVFAYVDGDRNRPRFSAGLGLFLAGRLFFDYKGSIFWKMQAGMGEIVFGPLYQALRARGVRFEFFHRVDQLHLSADRRRVTAITLARQAVLRRAFTGYEPLVRVADLPCFPAEPLVEQLTGPVAADAERHWSDRSAEMPRRLVEGVDFDDVVLAVSVGMIPHICQELLADSCHWRRMVDGIATVATASLQLWMRRTEAELGWREAGSTISGYIKPFDTYASMSHLIERECWPKEMRPGSIGYFCGVLPESVAESATTAHDALRDNVVEFLKTQVAQYWPLSVATNGDFRWDLLCNTEPVRLHHELDSQFWRANVDYSDRYVQSLPGSAEHRLRVDQSGYANLVLAGDWVKCGLDAGCIESAVMSGTQAANAVLGRNLTENVLGEWYGLTEP